MHPILKYSEKQHTERENQIVFRSTTKAVWNVDKKNKNAENKHVGYSFSSRVNFS